MYLKAHRPILYNSLTLKMRIYPHLLEIDETANRRLGQIMAQLTASNPPPDKATEPMAWVQP